VTLPPAPAVPTIPVRSAEDVLQVSLMESFLPSGRSSPISGERNSGATTPVSYTSVSGAITRMPSMAATAADVEREIMVWLRNAGDRNGGRKNRQLEKQRREQS